jgi:hypothetical protein
MTAGTQRIELLVQKDGTIKFSYHDLMDLSGLGPQQIRRASHVEPDEQGRWWVDLSPVTGPRLGPFDRRSDALASEVAWLECHVIDRG